MHIPKQATVIAKKAYGKLKGKPYVQCLEDALIDCKTILDVGCGMGSPVRFFSKKFYSVGIDLFKPAISVSRKRKIHNDYVIGDITQLCFRPNFFDGVLALDVIEHFEKDKGVRFIRNIEEIATKRVIIVTPNGFVPQGARAGNVYRVHRSGWTVAELKKLGYEVHGIIGLKILRKEEAKLRYNPETLFSEISDISQKITYHLPNIAFELLCVKNKASENK